MLVYVRKELRGIHIRACWLLQSVVSVAEVADSQTWYPALLQKVFSSHEGATLSLLHCKMIGQLQFE